MYDVIADQHVEEFVSNTHSIVSAIFDAKQCAMNHVYFQSFDWDKFEDVVYHFELTEIRPDPEMYNTQQSYARCNMEEIINCIPEDLSNYKY